ncbi:hypothetical protein [Acetobacterium sp.]|uniref:hypothetical protein n=1 Tax=Acetobacterium sp. TaxID=1872094 RepID=UPI002F42A712
MKSNEKNMSEKSKKTSSSMILYVAGSIVAVIAVALLIDNIMLFYTNLNQYVTQGYAAADVIKQLLPGQLLPGIFEPIAVYGGIALLLFYAGFINQKVSKGLMLLTEVKSFDDPTVERITVEKTTVITDMEPINQEETLVEDEKALDENK